MKVASVEVKQVDLPPDMQRAMAKQAEAEREKRAKIVHAAGELEASVKLAQAATAMAAEPMTITLRYLQTLTEIASEKNSTIIFPLPLELMNMLQAAPSPDAGRTHTIPTAPTTPFTRSSSGQAAGLPVHADDAAGGGDLPVRCVGRPRRPLRPIGGRQRSVDRGRQRIAARRGNPRPGSALLRAARRGAARAGPGRRPELREATARRRACGQVEAARRRCGRLPPVAVGQAGRRTRVVDKPAAPPPTASGGQPRATGSFR